jgi:hypothetical protein
MRQQVFRHRLPGQLELAAPANREIALAVDIDVDLLGVLAEVPEDRAVFQIFAGLLFSTHAQFPLLSITLALVLTI